MGPDNESEDSQEIVPSQGQAVDECSESSFTETLANPFPGSDVGILVSSETHEFSSYNPLYKKGTEEHLTMLIKQDGETHSREIELRKETLQYFGRRDSKLLVGFLGGATAVACILILSPESASSVVGILAVLTGAGVGAGNLIVKAKSQKNSSKEEK